MLWVQVTGLFLEEEGGSEAGGMLRCWHPANLKGGSRRKRDRSGPGSLHGTPASSSVDPQRAPSPLHAALPSVWTPWAWVSAESVLPTAHEMLSPWALSPAPGVRQGPQLLPFCVCSARTGCPGHAPVLPWRLKILGEVWPSSSLNHQGTRHPTPGKLSRNTPASVNIHEHRSAHWKRGK